MREHRGAAISRWLASSTEHPERAYEDWKRGTPAVLRTGVRFDAVRMPPQLVHAALGTATADDLPAALKGQLDGPVIADWATCYYALVPVGTCAAWREPVGTMRGAGGWVGVPRLDQRGPDGVHWITPAAAPGHLCRPDYVAALLHRGRARLEGIPQ
ncbi:hypothetical protein [Streptomyces corynorhini]|uniref:DNA primase/polymerase bifunctional N-terminal domain-containing protein n=1 Tax=Streptomyces corynorhini TaxID=2282652 RepID=A0A370B1J6_9ACTN|nr:hypothetical protein [Streptomyces corynorhini]RDG34542.1 hypothetical protein DVH02_30160 [Streptomyces corynorhini]